jgi:1-acyl-sn-glycerol-3-phosphate acyltransferase
MMPFRVPPLQPTTALESAGYWACHDILRILLRTLWRLSLCDVRELPDGPVILAANHRSFLDPLVLGAAVERRVTYMMTARYYDRPALNGFFRMSRCIVVDETTDKRKPLRDSLEVLQAGHVLGIFPEGHISPDGRLQPAQPGLGWLAQKAGAPVYPVWLGGTREALVRGEGRLRLSRVVVRMGAPRLATDFGAGREAADELTAAVMADLARLGGVDPPPADARP